MLLLWWLLMLLVMAGGNQWISRVRNRFVVSGCLSLVQALHNLALNLLQIVVAVVVGEWQARRRIIRWSVVGVKCGAGLWWCRFRGCGRDKCVPEPRVNFNQLLFNVERFPRRRFSSGRRCHGGFVSRNQTLISGRGNEICRQWRRGHEFRFGRLQSGRGWPGRVPAAFERVIGWRFLGTGRDIGQLDGRGGRDGDSLTHFPWEIYCKATGSRWDNLLSDVQLLDCSIKPPGLVEFARSDFIIPIAVCHHLCRIERFADSAWFISVVDNIDILIKAKSIIKLASTLWNAVAFRIKLLQDQYFNEIVNSFQEEGYAFSKAVKKKM